MSHAVLMLMLFLGLFFGGVASIMAFLITYEEYTRHFLDRRKPLLFALQSALITFLVFFVLIFLIGIVLSISQR